MELEYLIIFFIAMIGFVLGSFFSVLIFRLDKEKGILWGRSKCLACLTRLKWSDLVPLLSWIFLRGKCRYRRTKISFIYPFLELATVGMVLMYFFQNGFSLAWPHFYYLTIALLFLLLFFFDALYMILPDKITFSIIGLALIFNFWKGNGEWISFLITGFVLGLFFAIICGFAKSEGSIRRDG